MLPLFGDETYWSQATMFQPRVTHSRDRGKTSHCCRIDAGWCQEGEGEALKSTLQGHYKWNDKVRGLTTGQAATIQCTYISTRITVLEESHPTAKTATVQLRLRSAWTLEPPLPRETSGLRCLLDWDMTTHKLKDTASSDYQWRLWHVPYLTISSPPPCKVYRTES